MKDIRTARKNQVAQSVVEGLRIKPNNKIAEILPDNYKGRKDLDNIVRVLEKGEPIYLKINDSLLVLPKSDNAIINSNILFRDGKYEILKQGSDFEIYFIIPKGIVLESVKIYSYGYYLKN
jgi:hypothetical protein